MSPTSDLNAEEEESEEVGLKRRKLDEKVDKILPLPKRLPAETIENDGKEVLLRMFEVRALRC
jgi:hypothetical protein